MKCATVPTDPLPAGLTVLELAAEHLDGAVALSSEAHWNQTADDWRMMLAQGSGIGFADTDGNLVATAITLPYGPEFGWISMVLVTQTWRQQGLATNLLNRCIATLVDSGRVPFLDATPAGRHVYVPLGFVDHFGLTRWQRDAGTSAATTGRTRAIAAEDHAAVQAMDIDLFGGPRPHVVEALLRRAPGVSRRLTDGSGFVLGRDGRNAAQIGPLVADDNVGALALLADAVAAIDGPVFIDAMDDKPAISDWLHSNGFTEQRPFTRMARGRAVPFGRPARMYAVAGPELG